MNDTTLAGGCLCGAVRYEVAAVRGHCAACGSPLTYVGDADPHTIWLTIGSFDDPNRVPPTQEWYVATRLDWVRLDEALTRSAAAPNGD